jgi:hypothetical protein
MEQENGGTLMPWWAWLLLGAVLGAAAVGIYLWRLFRDVFS